ncbi:MAG: hypothetical protein HY363_05105 [Candidatus Aenigmarchaeota archaeon]|nr:hypothetical protein [Candidatus Aenigmarchaeota archaeon]
MIKDIHEIKECPDCASMNIIYGETRDQVICKDCGLIFEPFFQETNVPEKKLKKSVKKTKKKR